MKRGIMIVLLALGGSAIADPLVPGPSGLKPPEKPTLREKLRPIPFFYRQVDLERVNTAPLVRTNATRSEQQEILTGWWAPGTGGNAM